MKPGVDIVVVNYRCADDLSDFVQSLVAAPPQRNHNVTVVNVCPNHDDLDVAGRAISASRWTEQVWEDNVGYNVACNHAGSRGDREVVALFNADVVLRPGVIDEVCDQLLSHEDWAIAGPRQVDDRGHLTAAGIFGTSSQPMHRGWQEDGGDGRYADTRDDAITVSGAAMFVKRSVWDELTECEVYKDFTDGAVGPILPVSHFYGETAACYHARAHGFRLGFVGTATAVHKWHRASSPGSAPERDDADRAMFRAFCANHRIECD